MLPIILAHALALAIGFLAGLVLDHYLERGPVERDDGAAPREPRAIVADNGRAYLEPEDDR